jgi:hypothetical protein
MKYDVVLEEAGEKVEDKGAEIGQEMRAAFDKVLKFFGSGYQFLEKSPVKGIGLDVLGELS